MVTVVHTVGMLPDISRLQGVEDPFPANESAHTPVGGLLLVGAFVGELVGQLAVAGSCEPWDARGGFG